MHPFFGVMIGTFVLLLAVLAFGVGSIGSSENRRRSNKLMMARVVLGIILLIEILFYALILKPQG